MQTHPTLSSRAFYWGVFAAGFGAMVVAGFILIEGMLKFGGDASARNVFIAAGVVFQISETICFISSAMMNRKSLLWRIILFTLGTLLFTFSIAIMTLAQKATLFAGEQRNAAIEQQVKALNEQIANLNSMIGSYRLNAEKQSTSIYAESRQRGQDSLNRGTKLEEQKLQLIERLFRLNQSKQHTSSEFFKQLQVVTGLPSLQTEFYFLVIRSLLLELCGIVLMAFSSYLIALPKSVHESQVAAAVQSRPRQTKFAPITEMNTAENPERLSWASKYFHALRESDDIPQQETALDLKHAQLLRKVIELYRSGKLSNLEIDHIISVLNEYHNQAIKPDTAQIIQQLAKKRLNID